METRWLDLRDDNDRCDDRGLLSASDVEPPAGGIFRKLRIVAFVAAAVAAGAVLVYDAQKAPRINAVLRGGGSVLGALNGTSAAYIMSGCPAGSATQGCVENGGYDADCCAMPGTGSCAGGGNAVSGGQCASNGAVFTCCEVCPAGTYKHGCMENGRDDNDCCAHPSQASCYRGAVSQGSPCGVNGVVTTCCAEASLTAPPNDAFFCWMVSFSTGREADVTRLQFQQGLGIFACSKYAVFSDGAMEPVPTTNIGSLTTPMGDWGSWANTIVFVRAWKVVLHQGDWESCGWTIKVDPDAVWYPQRLLARLQNEDSFWPVYLRNNGKMMLGPLEVLSHGAMKTLLALGHQKCPLNPAYTGEDGWLTWCLDTMGVPALRDYSLMVFWNNNVGVCSNHQAVVFHPLKELNAWLTCHRAAIT